MRAYNILVVDDEPLARKNLILKLDELQLVYDNIREAESVDSALKAIVDYKPDIIFLDITMPDKDGFDLLKYLDLSLIQVIFTTAYNDFAIKAFEVNATGYILKPIISDKLQLAWNKATANIGLRETKLPNVDFPKSDSQSLAIHSQESIELRSIINIVRLEADANYTVFYLNDGAKIISSLNIGEYEKQLSDNIFFRSHRSHLINKKYILSYRKNGHIILSNGEEVPLSKRRKPDFLKFIS